MGLRVLSSTSSRLRIRPVWAVDSRCRLAKIIDAVHERLLEYNTNSSDDPKLCFQSVKRQLDFYQAQNSCLPRNCDSTK